MYDEGGVRKVVKFEKRDHVALVTRKRPEARSAFSPEMPFSGRRLDHRP
jgi:enoyl-CoA hydratase/carnithine racemase